MRKIIVPSLILGITMLFIACGPSAEEKAAAEQHMKDSIASAEKAIADSLLAVQQKAMEDSLAAVEAVRLAEQATADSLEALKSNKPKSNKPKPKAPEKPKEAPKSMKDVLNDKGEPKKDGETKSMKDLMKQPK